MDRGLTWGSHVQDGEEEDQEEPSQETAEEIIANDDADMVAMTRATICDPRLPNKAKEEREDEIRLCMNCNGGVGTGAKQCVRLPVCRTKRQEGKGNSRSSRRRAASGL